MLRHAAVLKPRRGVLVEAEQGEGHVGGCKRARRAAQRFANAGLCGRMPDAGDAGGEALRRHDLGLLEGRRCDLGAVPADAHERRHGAGAALEPDMTVERPKQRRGNAQQAIKLPSGAALQNVRKRLTHIRCFAPPLARRCPLCGKLAAILRGW